MRIGEPSERTNTSRRLPRYHEEQGLLFSERSREVLTRDEALLASLDPADREVPAAIAVHQDETDWNAFRDHVLPGIRARHREDAAALLKAYVLTTPPAARFGTHAGRIW